MVGLKFPGKREGVAVLVNLDKCIGCRACQIACKEWNGREPVKTSFSPTFTNPPGLLADTWKVVFFKEFKKKYPTGFEDPYIMPIPYNCLHCVEAPCATTCPVGAIKVSPEGAVVIEASECIGCGYCENACPYDVPSRDEATGKYYKCTFCVDRVQAGLEPACVSVCPTNVFEFGDAGEIMDRADRLKSEGKVVYGLDVDQYVGGSVRWIFAASKDKEDAIKSMFPEKAVVTTNYARGIVNNIIKYGGVLGIVLVGILGVIGWRKNRRVDSGGGGDGGEG